MASKSNHRSQALALTAAALALAGGLSACAFSKDGGKPKETQHENVVETLQREKNREAAGGSITENNVQVTFTPMTDLNVYVMKVSWPSGISRMVVSSNSEPQVVILKENFHQWTVSGGSVQNIRLEAFDSQGAPLSFLPLTRVAPRDYDFSKLEILLEDTLLEGNRLVFRGQGRIMTNGHSLSIKAQSIEIREDSLRGSGLPDFDRAQIFTRPPGSTAKLDTDLLGAKVNISAGLASGELTIALVAANGREGNSGPAIETVNKIERNVDPALAGSAGDPGKSIQALSPNPICLQDRFDPVCSNLWLCEREATPGKNGAAGKAGTNGGNGDNGGDTDSLEIRIQDTSGLNLSILARAGKAGDGGAGAEGFPGGAGGAAPIAAKGCKPQTAGQHGVAGPKGSAGKKGERGKIGQISLGGTKAKISEF